MRICSIENCQKKSLAKTYCSLHYQRLVHHGDPLKAVRPTEFHGGFGTVEYSIWQGMKSRCNVKSSSGYKWYGARGIKVCDRWNTFSNFLEDMGKRPSPKHSIERIDNEGDYEPSNCKWVLDSDQRYNKRTTIRFGGKTRPEWAKHFGIPHGTFKSLAVRRGDSFAVGFYSQKIKELESQ